MSFATMLSLDLPPAEARQLSAGLARLVAEARPGPVRLRLTTVNSTETSFPLPPTFVSALIEAINLLAGGFDVSLLPTEGELSPQEAGAILGCSRGEVMKLVNAAVLPARRVGTHLRVPIRAVLARRENALEPTSHHRHHLPEATS